jgi:hypothetical protein
MSLLKYKKLVGSNIAKYCLICNGIVMKKGEKKNKNKMCNLCQTATEEQYSPFTLSKFPPTKRDLETESYCKDCTQQLFVDPSELLIPPEGNPINPLFRVQIARPDDIDTLSIELNKPPI